MRLSSTILITALCCATLAACTSSGNASAERSDSGPKTTYAMDPHSFARPEEAVTTHLELDIRVDMDKHRITGTATYDLKRSGGDSVIFDTDGLTIERVTLGDGTDAKFTLGDSTFMGRALNVALPSGMNKVAITYSTGPDAKALQWLS
ncbi:MAG: aminopeptidase, partial [Flavobacteriales bacterium]